MKLLFVCSLNRFRSPTAEAIFSEYEGLEVDSAGLDRVAENPSEQAFKKVSVLFNKSYVVEIFDSAAAGTVQ